jgi:hypothetical protein
VSDTELDSESCKTPTVVSQTQHECENRLGKPDGTKNTPNHVFEEWEIVP